MFDNLSYGHLLVVALAAMFILGPERLPGAASWLARTIRQVKEFATDARDQLHSELGTDLEELRKPIEELRQPLAEFRNYNPRRVLSRVIFDEGPESTTSRRTPPPAPSQRGEPGDQPQFDREAT